MLYVLDYYDATGEYYPRNKKIGSMRSYNLEYFERYKNKECYRVVIRQGRKILYSEL